MSRIVRFGVSVPRELLEEFDKIFKYMGFRDRSKAIQVAMRNLVSEYKWMRDIRGVCTGAIIILFDHTVKGLEGMLTHVQHDFTDVITSTMHIHLDEKNCLEIIAVKGGSVSIKNLAHKLTTIRGVKQLKIAAVAI